MIKKVIIAYIFVAILTFITPNGTIVDWNGNIVSVPLELQVKTLQTEVKVLKEQVKPKAKVLLPCPPKSGGLMSRLIKVTACK